MLLRLIIALQDVKKDESFLRDDYLIEKTVFMWADFLLACLREAFCHFP